MTVPKKFPRLPFFFNETAITITHPHTVRMQFSESAQHSIAERFREIRTAEDLADVLNHVQEVIENESLQRLGTLKFDSKFILQIYSNPSAQYNRFKIPKKSGGRRTITAPSPLLKAIQRHLNLCLQCIFTPAPQATGFVPGRSVLTNAAMHAGKRFVYNIDLKDFFPSISEVRVKAVLSKVRPFLLHEDGAALIAALCCHMGALPQGAPTSPTLSNAVCMRLDRKLSQLADGHSLTYSRYADDITFSADYNAFPDETRKKLSEIIEDEGFSLNLSKERLQRYQVREGKTLIRERQEVTGVIVNEKPNVSRHYLRSLRAILHNWKTHGYAATAARYADTFHTQHGALRYNGQIPLLEHFVSGKLEYLGMVRGKDDPTYRHMKMQFDALCKPQSMDVDELSNILQTWKEGGLKKALSKFYSIDNLPSMLYGLKYGNALLSSTQGEREEEGTKLGFTPVIMNNVLDHTRHGNLLSKRNLISILNKLKQSRERKDIQNLEDLFLRILDIQRAAAFGMVTELKNDKRIYFGYPDSIGQYHILELVNGVLNDLSFSSRDEFLEFLENSGLNTLFKIEKFNILHFDSKKTTIPKPKKKLNLQGKPKNNKLINSAKKLIELKNSQSKLLKKSITKERLNHGEIKTKKDGESILTLDYHAKYNAKGEFELERDDQGNPKENKLLEIYRDLGYEINVQFIQEMFKWGDPYEFTIKFKLPTRVKNNKNPEKPDDLKVFVVAVDNAGKEHIIGQLKETEIAKGENQASNTKAIKQELFAKLKEAQQKNEVPSDFIEADGTSKITQIMPGRVNNNPTDNVPRRRVSELVKRGDRIKGFAIGIPCTFIPNKIKLITNDLSGLEESAVPPISVDSTKMSKKQANFFILVQDTSGKYRWVRVFEINVGKHKEVKEKLDNQLAKLREVSIELAKNGITSVKQLEKNKEFYRKASRITGAVKDEIRDLVRYRKEVKSGKIFYEPSINLQTLFFRKFQEDGIFSPEKFIEEHDIYNRPSQINHRVLALDGYDFEHPMIQELVDRTETDILDGGPIFVYPAFRIGDYNVPKKEQPEAPASESPAVQYELEVEPEAAPAPEPEASKAPEGTPGVTRNVVSDKVNDILNDDSDPFEFDFSQFTGERFTLDVEQARKDLRSILGDIDLKIVDGLIDTGSFQAYGLAKRSLIVLSKFAHNKTLFHEAFHIVFKGLISSSERTNLLNAARERYTLTDADLASAQKVFDYLKNKYNGLPPTTVEEIALEEKMADEFAEIKIIQPILHFNEILLTNLKN